MFKDKRSRQNVVLYNLKARLKLEDSEIVKDAKRFKDNPKPDAKAVKNYREYLQKQVEVLSGRVDN